MDGRCRALDNIFIERLWRSVKYESIYLHGYDSLWDLEDGLRLYFTYYNERRPHQSLRNHVPRSVFENPEILSASARMPPSAEVF